MALESRYKKWLIIRKILDQLKDKFALLKYFPDLPLRHVSCSYLCTIVNTFDPQFFPKATKKIQSKLRQKLIAWQPVKIEIDP